MLKFDWNILWTLINIVLFYVLMKLFLFKPIKKTIDKRKELIDKQFEDAQNANELANTKLAEYESKLEDVQNQAEQIIADAKDTAKNEYSKIVDRAEYEVKQLKEQAQKQIEADKDKARKAAKEELACLAMQAAEKVVGATVDSKTNSDIFDEFLNEGSVK